MSSTTTPMDRVCVLSSSLMLSCGTTTSWLSLYHSTCTQPINQSINQTINQSFNYYNNQLESDQPKRQPIKAINQFSVDQLINCSPVAYACPQPCSRAVHPPPYRTQGSRCRTCWSCTAVEPRTVAPCSSYVKFTLCTDYMLCMYIVHCTLHNTVYCTHARTLFVMILPPIQGRWRQTLVLRSSIHEFISKQCFCLCLISRIFQHNFLQAPF